MEMPFKEQTVESDDFYYNFYGCLDIEISDADYECDHVGDCSLEDFDDNLSDALIDYDFDERVLGNMMVSKFVGSLSDNEKYILSCLLNGMTHQEISDTMDCTRQNVTRTVERLGTKAIDFLSCN